MTTLAAPTGNEIQNTLAASYTRGTDTEVTLTDGADFPNSAHVIRISESSTKWCLVIYTTKATHVLTMGGGADDYALANNYVTDGTAVFAIGSTVELVAAADEIAQEMNSAIHDDIDGEIVAITEKTTPVAADEFLLEDSAATNAKKSMKLGYLPLTPWLRMPGDPYARTLVANTASRTSANVDIYVRTDGDDTNDGSDNNSGKALLTIQQAVDIIPDLIAHTVEIHVEDGTYEELVSVRNKILVTATASLTITGDTTTPANCVIAGDTAGAGTAVRRQCMYISNCTDVTVQGFLMDYGGFDGGSGGQRSNLYVESSTVRLVSVEIKTGLYYGIYTLGAKLFLGTYASATGAPVITGNTFTGIKAVSSYIEGGSVDLGHNHSGVSAADSYIAIEGTAAVDAMFDNSSTFYGFQAERNTTAYLRYVDIEDNATYGVTAELGSVVYVRYGYVASGHHSGTTDLAAVDHGMVKHSNDVDEVLTGTVGDADRDDIW